MADDATPTEHRFESLSASSTSPDEPVYTVLVTHSSETESFTLPQHAALSDLRPLLQSTFSILPEHQKLIALKLGLLKDDNLPITSLPSPPKKITLMGSSSAAIADAQLANSPSGHTMRKFGGTGPIKSATPSHRTDWRKASESSKYTFGSLNPLKHLPNWQRSENYLARLRDDEGIKAVMIKHKFFVPVLSEMDPAEHTTHESRTLGLNRDKGQEILLRLRTDDYDGYRAYDVVRKTLCHELAHNMVSPHDRNFWDLFKEIMMEVERADWKHGGRSVDGFGDGGRMRWEGDEEEMRNVAREDGGGWIGGTFILGGGSGSSNIATAGGHSGGIITREERARAAEQRMTQMKMQQEQTKQGNDKTDGSGSA